MTMSSLVDAAGRRRSPAVLPGYHAGRAHRNKGLRYPADPPGVDEIVAVMRHAADDRHGWRPRVRSRHVADGRETLAGRPKAAVRARLRPAAR
jgi:hypothetical protein